MLEVKDVQVNLAAADFSQIPMSQNLAATLARASDAANAIGSADVGLEHVLLSLCHDPDAEAVLTASRVDVGRLQAETAQYLGAQPNQPSSNGLGVAPELTRILEAAAAAARGSRRRDINGAIVLAAIVGDGKSVAAQILQAYGLTFDEAIRALQAALAPPARDAVPEMRPADDVLARARERVQSRSAPSLRDIMSDVPRTAPALPPPSSQSERPQLPPPGPSSAHHQGTALPNSADSTGQIVPEAHQSSSPAPDLGSYKPHSDAEPVPPTQPGKELGHAQQPVDHSVAHAAPERTVQPPMPPQPFERPAPLDLSRPTPIASPPPIPPPFPHQGGPQHAGPQYAGPQGFPQPAPPAGFTSGPPQRGGYGPPPPDGGYGSMGGAPPMPHVPQWDSRSAPYPGGPAPAPQPYGGNGPYGQMPPPSAPPPAMPAPRPRTAAPPDARQRPAAETGQLAENIPRAMRVGVTERVEIRIAKAAVKAITEGLEGGGVAWRHEVTITQAMSVRLRAPDGGFFVETVSPETQWIENQLGFAADDFASWRFLITPQARGWSNLQIVVSARTIGADGLAAETALPDQIVEVKVRTNYKRTFLRWAGWIVAAIAGGALSKFGEGGLSMAVSTISKLFK